MEAACRQAGVSRASFYRYWQRNAPKEEETAVRERLHAFALQNRHYGYRRIGQMLRREGYAVNNKRVLRLMQEDNLLALRRAKTVMTTRPDGYVRFPNLVRQGKAAMPDEVWVADITFVRLREEFCYLAVILDVCSRRVVGWSMGKTMTTQLTEAALDVALRERQPAPGWIHHSDRGAQYGAASYVDMVERHGGICSMSRAGMPQDNAYCESFMATLKREQVEGRKYKSLEDAKEHIGAFVKETYNKTRLHSALGYRSPAEFEAAWPSERKVRQGQDRVKAALTASLRLGLDPAPSSPQETIQEGQAGVG